jgi:quinol monooxygenase YgiN
MEARMSARWLLILGAMALMACFTSIHRRSGTVSSQRPIVRLAELQIDPTQLEQYLTFLREEVETSIRVEPGVLTLYAVQSKTDRTQVRLFEMYADSNAYNAHIASAHFRKYKVGTQAMVKSLVLHEADPILLGSKGSDVLVSYGVVSNQ